MADYQVTAGIRAEEEAIKSVTTALNEMLKQKNAGTKAIRAWRLRVMAWKRRITVINKNDYVDEDTANQFKILVESYNLLINRLSGRRISKRNINSVERQLTGLTDAIGSMERMEQVATKYQGQLMTAKNAVEEIRELVATCNNSYRQYQEQQAKFEDYQIVKREYDEKYSTYEDQLAEYKKASEAYREYMSEYHSILRTVNNNDYGINVLEINRQSKILEMSSGASSAIAKMIMDRMERFPQYGNEWAYADDLWDEIGTPSWPEDEDEINEITIATAISGALMKYAGRANFNDMPQVVRIVEGGKPTPPVAPEPVKQPEEPEPVELPTINANIEYEPLVAPENGVEEQLVSELDEFASGSYNNTRGREQEINALAERIGHGCPEIERTTTEYDNGALLQALSEVRATWSMFGGQRNSGHGEGIVADFKDSVNQLENASDYQTLKELSSKFDVTSTSLMVWLNSNWWQNGGTPTGNAHAWHGGNAIKLKRR